MAKLAVIFCEIDCDMAFNFLERSRACFDLWKSGDYGRKVLFSNGCANSARGQLRKHNRNA